jgi:hypothetical protein
VTRAVIGTGDLRHSGRGGRPAIWESVEGTLAVQGSVVPTMSQVSDLGSPMKYNTLHGMGHCQTI